MARPFHLPRARMVTGLRLWGFAALCLISGSGSLLHQAWPSVVVWPFVSCLHFGLIGVIGLSIATLQGQWRDLSWIKVSGLALAGVCLFVGPSVTFQLAAGTVSEYTSTALFCGIPLMMVLASSAFGSATDEGSRTRGLMMPSMTGLAGALLLFPIQSPSSLRRWLFLGLIAACCLVVVISSLWLHRLMRGIGVAAAIAVVGIWSAAILAGYGALIGWPSIGRSALEAELVRCAIFDLPIIWLTVWLTREIAPLRLSARFLFVPLVTILEGYALERGPVDSRAILAIGLLCAGAAMLLFKEEPDEIPGLRLR